ncbi:myosin-2 heavy chain-like [Argopecten irradians]|uniref:myosin-2 heavy chain-like n=1 Tax=Argopecten irradians TaxID=31199 RepID=UPI00371A0C8A
MDKSRYKVPEILSFGDNPARERTSEYRRQRAYVPTAETEQRLKTISGKLNDCLYDSYKREIDTLRPNVDIDREMELLIAAEEDLEQSRRNLRRQALKICRSNGPSKQEEQELKTLNKNSIQKMYELDDFIRDFDTKPYVATEMVDVSLERIVDNIRKRQRELQNLRKQIYEDSVLRVAGYYMKATEQKNSFRSASERIFLVPNVEKFKPKSSSLSGSDTEGDESYAEVKEIYCKEKLRLEKNLETFNTLLQEFIDSRSNPAEFGEEKPKKKKKKHQNGGGKIETKQNSAEAKPSNIAKIETKAVKSPNSKTAKTIKSDTKTAKNKVKPTKTSKSDSWMDKTNVRNAKPPIPKEKVTKKSPEVKIVKQAKSVSKTWGMSEPESDMEVHKYTYRKSMADIQAYIDSCDFENAEKPKLKKIKKSKIDTKLEFPSLSQKGCDVEASKVHKVQEPLCEPKLNTRTVFKVQQTNRPMSPGMSEDSEEENDQQMSRMAVVKVQETIRPMSPGMSENSDEENDQPVSAMPMINIQETDRPMSQMSVDSVQKPLPLPTLKPMPKYIDNFQASCVLTQLFSRRDDYDEDFEEDYIIPTYESEQWF